jgi:4-amino-4-deoxy-L-arabinose transferase-like glycosyltransferase
MLIPPESAESVRPAQPSARLWARLQRDDLRNIGLILAGAVVVLLLIPLQHEYPIIDDGVYARSVQSLLQTGRFIVPPEAQATLIGLTYWGGLWAALLGFSFTTLTISTLVLAVVGLIAFYGIARRVAVPPAAALLGTALLGLNPLFVHLSYSFMTDVPFLALMLVACYCYLRGMQERSQGWLWVGGLFAGWALLIRQFGLLVPLAFLLYLALGGLRAHRLRWPQLLGFITVPGLVFGGWYLWSRQQPPTQADVVAASRTAAFLFKAAWAHVILLRTLTMLPWLGLFAWSALLIRPARRWLIPLITILVVAGLYAADWPMGQWNPQTEPLFTARLGPLAVPLPQEEYAFGRVGNILRVDGIDFFQYSQQPLWTPEAWRALWVFAVALGVLLLAKMTDGLLDWLRGLRQGQPLTPLAGFYGFGLLTLGVSVAVANDFYDRYVLAILPCAILFVVRGAAGWGRRAWAYAGVALACLALFTLLLKADQVDHDNARWAAGHWLQARGAAPQVGYDWDPWVGPGNPNYHVTDMHQDGFRIEQRFPYLSRLSGFTTRYVLAEAAATAPPLPLITP